ncbi:hypothetical protein [Hoeflea sp. BAL378]|uniref:hypothetical protein n=1 Tax=Hoeflea sp. BAL378 TaxID=1547437 RepID=UPI0013773F2E|nr:hypothetical protein [Hoeflea sp. BAL378]
MPATTSALSPALSIMQSIVADQALRQEQDRPVAPGAAPTVAVTPGYSARVTEKLNAYYFGDHLRVSEVQARIFTHLAQYVGQQIDAVEAEEAGDPSGASSAGTALKNSLKAMDADARGGLRNALDEFAEGKRSVQSTALKMFMTLDLDVLSKDSKITRYLEQLIGFDLHGMSAEDILKSFVDPGGKENDKLRSIVSNALAGQDGSKAMQRLEDASTGIQSVDDTKREVEDVKPYDEVDDETKEEDQKDIRIAKAYAALTEAREMIDAARQQDAELAKAKAEIEAAGQVTRPADEPVADENGAPDGSDADGDADPAYGNGWGYRDQDEKAGDGQPAVELYL